MDFNIEQQGLRAIITLNKSRVLGTESVELQNSILDLIQKGSKEIEIDLSLVKQITSWGIGMLIHALTTCTNREIGLSLTGVTENVFAVIEKVKLHTIFNIQMNSK